VVRRPGGGGDEVLYPYLQAIENPGRHALQQGGFRNSPAAEGQRLTALNGGPIFKFSEAVSLQVYCKDQKEIDYYWERLGEGGDPKARQCGWLKDKYGLSWQVVPEGMQKMMKDHKSPKAQRARAAVMQMKKFDVAALERAVKG
jgi:predicted 3-demethylubiquinone-9 3-methyltransferase (glyoxalase superfamily)